jgi:2-polyprenyl-6-methoxyphenol hydroxylase-like FAD-dependent oxidoreductase
MVLQVLYDNIRDKSKILSKKRIAKVELNDNGVTVKTTDNFSYTGHILIGADGIHSAVRGEMWRLANEMSPGWIPADEHSGEY